MFLHICYHLSLELWEGARSSCVSHVWHFLRNVTPSFPWLIKQNTHTFKKLMAARITMNEVTKLNSPTYTAILTNCLCFNNYVDISVNMFCQPLHLAILRFTFTWSRHHQDLRMCILQFMDVSLLWFKNLFSEQLNKCTRHVLKQK